MTKEWTEWNKTMQLQLKKQDTFLQGINTWMTLRKSMMQEADSWLGELSKEEFCAIPFINAKGYHNKTIAYSLWHMSRIEDITAHTLMNEDEQIFFLGNFQKRMNAPIITTGNELEKQQISDFSKQLDLTVLYEYMHQVGKSTEDIINQFSFGDLKRKFTETDKDRVRELQVVSTHENAVWLIDYWGGKDIRGLIQMPFSRHWTMHMDASLRIKNKVKPS